MSINLRSQHQFIWPLFMAVVLIVTPACITVKVGPKDPEKARDLVLQEPAAPFEKIASPSADLTWKNKKTGNIISLFSECFAGNEASLESLQMDASRALDESVAEKTEPLEYNEREAIRADYNGKLDGIAMHMGVLTLKKNSCSYIISMVGKKDRFAKDLSAFETFLKGFKAP